MLMRMRPDQVQAHWEEIKVAIYESLPIWTGERGSLMNDILISILTEKMVVWISYQIIDGVHTIDGIITTVIVYNEYNKTKNILIHTVYGYHMIPQKSLSDAYEAGMKYAKANECDSVFGYTDNESMLMHAKAYKLNITNMITVPIGG